MPALRRLRRATPPPRSQALRRVGHKGADLIVPGNTRESFDAALRAGVDMIEFDVLPLDPGGDYARTPLILAHDYGAAARGEATTLEEGLAHFTAPAFAHVDLDVDLKLPGYEARVVRALQRHRLVERALVSTQYRSSLAVIRRLEPRLRLGWSVPKVRRDYTQSRLWLGPALAALLAYRVALPPIAARAVARGECDALMAHWRVVTPRLVRAVHAAGGEVYVWTVDEAPRIQTLEALGVTGVISNDPRLFGAPASEAGSSPAA